MARDRGRATTAFTTAGAVLAVILWTHGAAASQVPDDPSAERANTPVAPKGQGAEPSPGIGDMVGLVTRVDEKRREVHTDFGRAQGADVGVRLGVRRPNPDPQIRFDELGHLELTSVSDRECTAKVLEEEGLRIGPDPPQKIQAGDEVYYDTDPQAFRVLRLALSDRPDALRELNRARLEAARRWVEVHRAFYENGEIAIDRYIEGSRKLMDAERDVATTKEAEIAAIRAHFDRMGRLALRETRKFEVGNGSFPNISEVRSALADAAVLLAESRKDGPALQAHPPRAESRSREIPSRPEPPRKSLDHVWLMPGQLVGQVAAVDPGRGQVRIKFGCSSGAEVGMRLAAFRTVRNADPPSDVPAFLPIDEEINLGALEVTSVQETECTAQVVRAGSDPKQGIRAGDAVRYASGHELRHLLELATSDQPGATDELGRTRILEARRRVKAERAFYQNGAIDFERYADASRNLMEAERTAARDHDSEIAAIRGHLERMTQAIEWLARGSLKLDSLDFLSLIPASYYQAEAALMLARLRRAAQARRDGAAP